MTGDVKRRPAEEPAGGLSKPRQGRAVNVELRSLAVAAVVEEGMDAAASARRFGLGRSAVQRWVAQFREHGHVRPGRQGGCKPSRIEPEREWIFRILKARPGLTVLGLRDALAAEGLSFGRTTVHRFLVRHRPDRNCRYSGWRRKRKAGR